MTITLCLDSTERSHCDINTCAPLRGLFIGSYGRKYGEATGGRFLGQLWGVPEHWAGGVDNGQQGQELQGDDGHT